MPTRFRRGERGFVLIELMIVILVILTLAAIVLPQLGLAQERARKALCVSNQRDLETAVTMWASDHPTTYLVAGTFDSAGTTPNYGTLTTVGQAQYAVRSAFVEPDDTGAANQSGHDYYLYDGNANGGSLSPEYGHVTCNYQGVADPWVDNRNTPGGGTALDHRRNPLYTP